MITVKQFIQQQNDTEWDLENSHLTNLQDNELVLIDDEPYIKTKVIFVKSESPAKVAKIEDLEIENMRLQLEVEYLQLENEKILRLNTSLQGFVYNLQRDTERQKAKHIKLHQMEEMSTKIKKLKEEKEELAKNIKELNKMKRTIEVLQEQNENLVKKNKKLRHAAQFFGEANNTIQKLNAQVQKAKTYFEKTDID